VPDLAKCVENRLHTGKFPQPQSNQPSASGTATGEPALFPLS